MLNEIIKFELKTWLSKPSIYIFFIVNFLLVFMAVTNEDVSIGDNLDNININAPYAIVYYVSFLSLISILMITAIMNQSALKDYESNFHSILFTTSIDKRSYLIGRFVSGIIISLFVFCGVYLALLISFVLSDTDPSMVSVFNIGPYFNSFILYVLPNTLLIGAIIFALASWFRNMTASFVGAVIILIGYLVAGVFVMNLDNENLAVMLDPLGIHSLSIITKYWTVDDKNTLLIPLNSGMAMNRLVWGFIALCIFVLSYFKTKLNASKTEKKCKENNQHIDSGSINLQNEILPIVNTYDNLQTGFLQFYNQVKIEFLSTVKSPAFVVIMLFAVLNTLNAITFTDMRYGNGNYPVTFLVVEAIENSFFIFIIVIITYYSGAMIWRERRCKINEIIDATPYRSNMPLVSKYCALLGVVFLFLTMAIAMGVLIQLLKGYTNFEMALYFKQLILVDGIAFAIMIAVSMFVHVLVNNMYLGFFVFVALLLFNSFGWAGLGLDSNLLEIASRPSFRYSDITKFVPFVIGLSWYSFYWLIFASIVFSVSILFWVRGKSLNFKDRVKIAKLRSDRKMFFSIFGLLGVWIVTGSFLYYNANILNDNLTDSQVDFNAFTFESNYAKFKNLPQPRIVSLDYTIDIFPGSKSIKSTVDVVVKNKHDIAIDELHFTYPDLFNTRIEISKAKMSLGDSVLGYYIFNLKESLMPGDSFSFKVYSDYVPKGIENEISTNRISQNASFIDSKDLMPIIGYGKYKELSNNDTRAEYGLPKRERTHSLSHDCSLGCNNSYISSDADWIALSCTISTSADQTAIAPGNLINEVTSDGRNYYRYELDKPVINFYSFLSGKFEVKKEKWNDVDLEVYYHKNHAYNVDRMLLSMRKSLDYFDKTFAPYPFKQARIIEFPRYASFAQAFPGTMPYSEGIGFLADLEKDNAIDQSFYIVAHEMAHQWWGHQVVPANVQGGTMLAESFAQYSALMVMEEEYGKEIIQDFLEYEMDIYLRSRGSERTKELPLYQVEDQAYIHYRKGSVVMYALSQYIGVDALNKALRNFAASASYAEPPYPTSLDFLKEVEMVTPDSLKYLVDDLFKKIIIFNNRAVNAEYKELPNGKYEIEFTFEVEKYEADAKGKEKNVVLNDYIYIGVYGGEIESEKLIYYKSHKITNRSNTVKIIVNREPTQIGIDPIHLLIDRVPDDNLMDL